MGAMSVLRAHAPICRQLFYLEAVWLLYAVYLSCISFR